MSDPQETVYNAVAARGYTKDLTDEQFLAKQPVKAIEELYELFKGIDLGIEEPAWVWHLRRSAIFAKKHFDYGNFSNASIQSMDGVEEELVDLQVVILCAAQAISRIRGRKFNIVAAAVDKATQDIERGVRE